jgi:parallel beta-helix repeat protein
MPVKNTQAYSELLESRFLLTTYYVDTNSSSASDKNAGTSLSVPLKTINQALILVSNDNKTNQQDKAFVWTTDGGSSVNSRTIISAYVEPNGQYDPVYIDAANPTTGTWIQNGTTNIWYLPNFSTETAGVWVDWSSTNDNASLFQIGTYGDSNGDTRTITGSGVANMTAGTYYGDKINSRLYVWLADGSNPNSHKLEYSSQAHTFYLPGTAVSGGYTYASNLDFVGFDLRHTDAYLQYGQDAGTAIYLESNERAINCNIQWNTGEGVGVLQQSQVINCICNNNGGNGIYANGQGFLINGGQISYNYWRHYTYGSEAGIKIISNVPTIWGNVTNADISYNFGKGIWYDTCFEGTIINRITGNYIHDNTGDGIDLEASRNFLVANNVISYNGNDGIIVNAVENATIDNNTIVGNNGLDGGFAAIELNGGARDQGTVYPGTTGEFNNVIDNNIIYNNTTTYDIDIPTLHPSAYLKNNISDYNLFFRSGSSIKFTDGGTYIGGCPLTATTLAGWIAATGMDSHSISKDPLFLGSQSGIGALSYRIAEYSPAFRAGLNLSSIFSSDYIGSPRFNAGYDLGAWQDSQYGDANNDGVVDGSDYSLIDNGFNNHLTGWHNGDFDNNGVIDGSDYTLIDNEFNTQIILTPTVASKIVIPDISLEEVRHKKHVLPEMWHAALL